MLGRISRLFRRHTITPGPSGPTSGPLRGATAPPTPAGQAREYSGRIDVEYTPVHDGHPDPGEVVWTWVPYQDDPGIGKDRPVVIVGWALDGRPGDLAALQLSSKPHPGESRWLPIGTGDWDRAGRNSSVRLDRVLAVAPTAVRREGATLSRERFDAVVRGARAAGRVAKSEGDPA